MSLLFPSNSIPWSQHPKSKVKIKILIKLGFHFRNKKNTKYTNCPEEANILSTHGTTEPENKNLLKRKSLHSLEQIYKIHIYQKDQIKNLKKVISAVAVTVCLGPQEMKRMTIQWNPLPSSSFNSTASFKRQKKAKSDRTKDSDQLFSTPLPPSKREKK